MDYGGVPMAETEKITINMSVVDLGKIDLLVEEGFYSNRTDFIRAAIRQQLNQHGEAVQQSVTRKSMVLGILSYDRADLEKLAQRGDRVSIRVLGMLTIADDVSPELARQTIESIKVLGTFKVNKAVQQAIADRVK
ncbi:MAG: CopG family transcriptional regulator [Ardenticatenaceae bacterium]|nr:CopG family transcriptional regulator [Ardenticatenaceae bacterium]